MLKMNLWEQENFYLSIKFFLNYNSNNQTNLWCFPRNWYQVFQTWSTVVDKDRVLFVQYQRYCMSSYWTSWPNEHSFDMGQLNSSSMKCLSSKCHPTRLVKKIIMRVKFQTSSLLNQRPFDLSKYLVDTQYFQFHNVISYIFKRWISLKKPWNKMKPSRKFYLSQNIKQPRTHGNASWDISSIKKDSLKSIFFLHNFIQSN